MTLASAAGTALIAAALLAGRSAPFVVAAGQAPDAVPPPPAVSRAAAVQPERAAADQQSSPAPRIAQNDELPSGQQPEAGEPPRTRLAIPIDPETGLLDLGHDPESREYAACVHALSELRPVLGGTDEENLRTIERHRRFDASMARFARAKPEPKLKFECPEQRLREMYERSRNHDLRYQQEWQQRAPGPR